MDDRLGAMAVAAARAYVEEEVGIRRADVPSDPGFSESRGVFVTLRRHPSGDLRGCIGYPHPIMSLADALEGAARSACHDPRFRDLSSDEVAGVTVEVTVLTVPEDLDASTPEETLSSVVIGRDGLILECRGRRAILLPQVPSELGWDAGTYLAQLSMKAGLPPDAWAGEDARIMSFKGDVFSEDTPCGNVSRRDADGYRHSNTGQGVRRRTPAVR